MSEAIQTAIVDLAVKKLVTKSYGEIMSAMNIESEVRSLQTTRTLIEAALVDARLMPEHSHAQQDTLEKLSCELDKLTDFMDVRATRAKLKQVMEGSKLVKEARLFFSASNQLVARFKDAQKVKDIRKKLDFIARDHAMFGSILPSDLPRTVSSYNIVTDLVVGRDGERDDILNMLLGDTVASQSLSVASIVGIGGIGKTTLAWYVYNDERVKSCFDAQFWVTATQNFDFKEVLNKTIASASTDEKLVNCEIDQLYHYFHRAIGGKKLLLVLDNMWDQDDLRVKWLDFRRLLDFGASGSKVLITTRDKKVAAVMDSDAPFMLQDLKKGDSWLLFQKIAFTKWQEPGVEAIGKEIAKMCPNVPLVIRSIGGLLAGKRTIQEWQAFRDDQLANFASYGRDIMQTLKLSYDRLDARLKECVNYCTLFPKGMFLSRHCMICHWMALGYIVPKYSNQSLEEAGEDYVIKLVDCGFFNSFIDSEFIMQHVMYELVLLLAGSKYKVVDSSTNEFDEGVRHVSTWKLTSEYHWEVPSSLFKIRRLKSFIAALFGTPFGMKVKYWSISNKYILKFQYLNVLDLHGVEIQDLPASIGELICLRFLGLSSTNVVKIPTSITRLVNLQSLYLRDRQELPSDISKLMSLRHLVLGGTRGSNKLSHMPLGLGNLTNLRTLSVFVVGEKIGCGGKLADLNGLDNLSGSLRIEVHRESKDIASSEIGGVNLHMKEKLKELQIDFKKGTKEDGRVLEYLLPPSSLKKMHIEGYGGERLPSWMTDQIESHLPNLVCFWLINCKACRNLCSLGRLLHLKNLRFDGLDEVEYIEDSGNGNTIDDVLPRVSLFPSLETFGVLRMPNLKGWWSSGEQDWREPLQVQRHQDLMVNWTPTFPKLKELIVDSLELAFGIARQHLGGFTSLDTLHIRDNKRHQHQQPLTLVKCCFPKLLNLYYSDTDEVEVLPEAFRDLSSLTHLRIEYCEHLRVVPGWIDTLTSLEYLRFYTCPNMESLPHQFGNLRNLKTFSVSDCPILEEKCDKPNGEYWPLIQHIPCIIINNKRI